MGFFSSRKVDADVFDDKASVSRIIRSRFYGRNKGKAPEVPSASNSPARSAQPPLSASPRLPPKHLAPTYASDHAESAGRVSHPPQTPQSRPQNGQRNLNRASTDAVTASLAQRLGELATANTEGLLNDEEYRVLRQSLFERYASGSAVPTEAPLVHLSAVGEGSDGRASSRPVSSQFHVQFEHAPSVQSKISITSTVTGLLRRATGRRSDVAPSVDHGSGTPRSDTASVFSSGSHRSTGLLGRKTSDASIRANGATGPLPRSSSRRRRAGWEDPPSAGPSPLTPGSSRRFATIGASAGPPSAFRGAALATPVARQPPRLSSDDTEDAHLVSAADIRHEIELVEAEAHRLQDTFNGLELSTLTRRHRGPVSRLAPAPRTPSGPASGWRGSQEGRTTLRAEADAVSVHSSHSRGYASSLSRAKSGGFGSSGISTGSANPGGAASSVGGPGGLPLVAQPVSLARKASFSSLASRLSSSTAGRRRAPVPGPSTPPPSAPSSLALGRHSGASSSTLNLGGTGTPLATVVESDSAAAQLGAANKRTLSSPRTPTSTRLPLGAGGDDDEEYTALEAEMAEIRRKRAEVTERYAARLGYLRARLKAAEIHEKLLRK